MVGFVFNCARGTDEVMLEGIFAETPLFIKEPDFLLQLSGEK